MSMKKFLALAGVSLLLAVSGQPAEAAGRCLEAIKWDGVMKVGVGLMGLKPYVWQQPDGTYTGFEKEMTDYIADKLGVSYEYVVTEWTTLIPGLKAERWDIILSGMAKTQERIQGGGIDYSDPYLLIYDRIIVLQDSDIKSREDLKGKKLASTLGTMDSLVAHSLVDAGDAAEVLDFNTFGEPFLALRNGEADAVIMDETTYIAQKEQMADLSVVGDPLFYIPKAEWKEAEEKADYRLGGIAVGVRMECTDLKDAINKALAEMDADGTREKILTSYNIWSDVQKALKKSDQ